MNRIYEKTGKIIRIIGVLTFACGMIVSLRFIWEAIDYSDFDAFLIAIGIIIGSFVSAMMIIGFSIIIEKLKESVEIQKSIWEKLKESGEISEKINCDTIMHCKNCGSAITDEDDFCSNCLFPIGENEVDDTVIDEKRD
ncbi:MAG: zinc ribbon domain-containing protein [Clostridium sp.]|nr:zinc ribbon domain-containing protein [Clostridium sp.]